MNRKMSFSVECGGAFYVGSLVEYHLLGRSKGQP